jgi:hypothetical protein
MTNAEKAYRTLNLLNQVIDLWERDAHEADGIKENDYPLYQKACKWCGREKKFSEEGIMTTVAEVR